MLGAPRRLGMYRSSPRPRSLSQVRSGLWSVCVRTFPVKWDSLVVVIGGGSGKGPLSTSGVPSSHSRYPMCGDVCPFSQQSDFCCIYLGLVGGRRGAAPSSPPAPDSCLDNYFCAFFFCSLLSFSFQRSLGWWWGSGGFLADKVPALSAGYPALSHPLPSSARGYVFQMCFLPPPLARITSGLRIDSLVAECRRHETLLHFGPPGSRRILCYYHQDLHRRRLRVGSRPVPSVPTPRPPTRRRPK